MIPSALFDKAGIAYTSRPDGAATVYQLRHCVFGHGDSGMLNEAAVIQHANGRTSYHCYHQDCGKTWGDVMDYLGESVSEKPLCNHITALDRIRSFFSRCLSNKPGTSKPHPDGVVCPHCGWVNPWLRIWYHGHETESSALETVSLLFYRKPVELVCGYCHGAFSLAFYSAPVVMGMTAQNSSCTLPLGSSLYRWLWIKAYAVKHLFCRWRCSSD